MNELVQKEKNNISISISKELLVKEIEDNLKKDVLDSELKDVEDIYSTLKQHVLDELNISNNQPTQQTNPRLGARNNLPPKKSSMYLASQTNNLISLKNLKLQMLKEQTRISESKIDRQLKLLNLLKEEKDENDNEISAKDILNYLINEIRAPLPITGESIDVTDSIENEMYDNELDKRLSEETNEPIIEKTLEVNEFSSNEDGLIFDKYDIDGDSIRIVYNANEDKFYLIDSEGNVLENINESELNLTLDDTDENNVFIRENISGTIVEEI